MRCAKECIGGTWIEQNVFFLHNVVVVLLSFFLVNPQSHKQCHAQGLLVQNGEGDIVRRIFFLKFIV